MKADFLAGGGEMGARTREFDWAQTPLGPISCWPQSLRTSVSLILNSKFPTYLVWGPALVGFYNDAYRPVLGNKPEALGRSFSDVWAEAWDVVGPIAERALAGEASYFENLPLTLERRGYREQTWWTFSYSPVRDETGDVGGVLCTVHETTGEVLARAALNAERDHLADLFRQAPGFICVLSGAKHRFDLANDSYKEVVGGRDVVGKTVAEALPEVIDQGFITLLDRVFESGEPYVGARVPITLERAGKPETVIVDFIYQPIKGPDGTVTGIFVQGNDVTEQVRAVEARAESEERLRLATQASAIGTWDHNPVTGALRWDDRCKTLFGLPPDAQVTYDAFLAVLHPDDREPTDAAVQKALRPDGDGRYAREFRAIGPQDGIERWIVATGQAYFEQGRAVRFIGTVRDITDRKRAEAGLAASEAALRALNESLEVRVVERTADRDRMWRLLTDLMLVTTLDGTIQAVNPAWTSLLGWDEAELLGRSVLELVHPEDLARTRSECEQLSKGLPTHRFENRYRRKDGFFITLSWTAVPDESRLHAVGRDVTAEKEQAEALRQTEEALRQAQKMEAVGQLTGGLAHDFNNLLTGITGSLELLNTRIVQGRLKDLDRYINAAQGAAGRAASLTHRLLAFSRRQTLDPRPTDVNRLIAGMEELIRRTVGPAITVEVVGAAGLWTTLVDPNQLESALLNLCINARDAMPKGGRITIETANKWLDERAARERDLPPGQFLSLCVTDTGTGMPPEVIARAFDPFFTTKPIGQGTGLGLSMIYGFVRQSGGQVRIYSELDRGTTMCLYLPRHYGREAEADEAAELAAAPRAEQGETVLIVDDEPTVRMLVTDVLEDLGYTAIEAADGAAGLQVLRSDARIDLLVTDVGLPGGMNGRQLADAGRAVRPGLQVLFITGYAENAVLSHGHLEPGMHVLTKPFAMEMLASRIKAIITGG